MDRVLVRASGGVVWRLDPGGQPEVLLVHRPRYDDWTLPKGKADLGESDEDTARREVEEETGFSTELGAELPSVTYQDRNGRTKVVRYWAMGPVGQPVRTWAPNDEIDGLRWLPIPAARAQLTYEHDREVLDDFAARVSDVAR